MNNSSRRSRLPKALDLPRVHLSDVERDYVPPKARDLQEIERRRRLPPHALLAEEQLRGTLAGVIILRTVVEPDDVAFACGSIAEAAANTAWYQIGRNATQMRRALSLAMLADSEYQHDPEALMNGAADGMEDAARLAGRYVRLMKRSPLLAVEVGEEYGKAIGNVASKLSSIKVAELLAAGSANYSDVMIQEMVRDRALELLGNARGAGEARNTKHPSLAQLANPISDLSLYWHDKAPDGALVALQNAQVQAAALPM